MSSFECSISMTWKGAHRTNKADSIRAQYKEQNRTEGAELAAKTSAVEQHTLTVIGWRHDRFESSQDGSQQLQRLQHLS